VCVLFISLLPLFMPASLSTRVFFLSVFCFRWRRLYISACYMRALYFTASAMYTGVSLDPRLLSFCVFFLDGGGDLHRLAICVLFISLLPLCIPASLSTRVLVFLFFFAHVGSPRTRACSSNTGVSLDPFFLLLLRWRRRFTSARGSTRR